MVDLLVELHVVAANLTVARLPGRRIPSDAHHVRRLKGHVHVCWPASRRALGRCVILNRLLTNANVIHARYPELVFNASLQVVDPLRVYCGSVQRLFVERLILDAPAQPEASQLSVRLSWPFPLQLNGDGRIALQHLQVDRWPDRHAAWRLHINRQTAIAITFARQCGHLYRIPGVRLQARDIIDESVDYIEFEWLVQEPFTLRD